MKIDYRMEGERLMGLECLDLDNVCIGQILG